MTSPKEVLVYEAEGVLQILGVSTRFHSIEETQGWIDMVQSDRYALERYPHLGTVKVVAKKSRRYEWAGAHTDTGILMCPPWSMNNVVMAHEMAHFAAQDEEDEGIDHGPVYCGAHLYILRRFVSEDAARSVRLCYQAYGVEYEEW